MQSGCTTVLPEPPRYFHLLKEGQRERHDGSAVKTLVFLDQVIDETPFPIQRIKTIFNQKERIQEANYKLDLKLIKLKPSL